MPQARRRPDYGDRRRLDEAEFRRRMDALKASVRMSSVVGKAVKLVRSGHEWKALCPFHNEKSASFTIVDALGWGHCFGCGWHGDQIRFVMDAFGVGFREAYQRLVNEDLPTWTPQEREVELAEVRLEQLKDEQDARRFFKEAAPIAGTDGEIYLRARGITIAMPDTVRFGMVPTKRDKETGRWNRPRPAVICGAEDLTGAIIGVQRIYFRNDDPRLGKADCKLSLGTVAGCVCRLGPAEAAVVLPEAPEDGMSIFQEGPGLPVWIPFGTSMMPQVVFPPIVKRVILAGQNNTASRIAVNKSAIKLSERGLEVGFAWPDPQYDDWNDQLKATRS